MSNPTARTIQVHGTSYRAIAIEPWDDSFTVQYVGGEDFLIVTSAGNRDGDLAEAIHAKRYGGARCQECAPLAIPPVVDTRHADAAYARQVADEATPAAPVALMPRGWDRIDAGDYSTGAPRGWDRIEAGTEATERQASADFAAAHDAHMSATYAEAWDAVPADCPTTGDPLTGIYGRTYAEGGYLAMQAARDMFGPVQGHAPILLFYITGADRAPILHTGMGGARLAHVATCDTWQGALMAMRQMIDGDTFNTTLVKASACGTCSQARAAHCGNCNACPGQDNCAWCGETDR